MLSLSQEYFGGVGQGMLWGHVWSGMWFVFVLQGFLGVLHMDVFLERLDQEFGAQVLTTTPTGKHDEYGLNCTL